MTVGLDTFSLSNVVPFLAIRWRSILVSNSRRVRNSWKLFNYALIAIQGQLSFKLWSHIICRSPYGIHFLSHGLSKPFSALVSGLNQGEERQASGGRLDSHAGLLTRAKGMTPSGSACHQQRKAVVYVSYASKMDISQLVFEN